ncbi:MAG: SUMF1/EgtB/PvdO family nonheme iron enzyme [Candidatus Delongbacteria bacterium]|nr:SUMF1/EgtB/PvdO family nonheme iron enzyme [Candidatus Delongbacteria bacterium]
MNYKFEEFFPGYIFRNHYEIKEISGNDRYGFSYHVLDKNDNEIKIIKIFDPAFSSDDLASDIKLKYEQFKAFNSENIIKIYDMQHENSLTYFLMEYLDGNDLNDPIIKHKENSKSIPENEVISIINQICKGMEAIHKITIIGNLSPQNIIITKEQKVKIIPFDYFIITGKSDDQIHFKEVSSYLSPELILGKELNSSSDVWSFGVILYELLSGDQLFRGASKTEVLKQIRRASFEPINGISAKINDLIKKCIKYDLKNRFKDFSAVREYLETYHEKPEEEIETIKNISEKPLTEKEVIENNLIPAKQVSKKVKKKANKKTKTNYFFILVIIFALVVTITKISINHQKQVQIEQLLLIANRYHRSGSIEEAKEKYDSVISLDPDNREARDGLRKIQIEIERIRETENKLKQEEQHRLEKVKKNKEAENKKKETEYNIQQKMIYVEGGWFYMGNNESDNDEKPLHKVYLDDFYISNFEVTHREFIDFLNDRRIRSDGFLSGTRYINMHSENCAIGYRSNKFYFKGSKLVSSQECPVIEVTWYGADAFCKWKGGRLPTEAEWEYAAKGGVNKNNYVYCGGNNIDDVAWHGGNASDKIHPVGKKKQNDLGIFDMSGNVWEWCSDWYDSNYYENSPDKNPSGHVSRTSKIIRGGSWNSFKKNCRTTNRSNMNPNISSTSYGFRFLKPKK